MAARDVLFIGVFLFGLACAFLVAHLAFNLMIDGLVAHPEINGTAAETAFEGTAELTGRFDYLVLGVFIALSLALLITGWFVGGNPLFMFVYFIVVVLATVAAGVLAWFWEQFSQASVLAASLASFPITDHLVSNLHIYIAVLGVVGMVVMFAKPSFSEGGAI